MQQDIIILAGGFGTRLSKVVSDTPKPMALVNNKPFLYYLFKQLEKIGAKHVILATGYLNEKISSYFQHSFGNIKIDYAVETEPLGTGGAIQNAMQYCDTEQVLVMNGDTYFDIPIQEFIKKHLEKKADFSLALRNVKDCSRYGFVEINKDNQITKFGEKKEGLKDCLINGGTYLINQSIFSMLPLEKKFSMEKEVFEKQLNTLKLTGIPFDNYFIDIGIPEDYKKAQYDFKNFTD